MTSDAPVVTAYQVLARKYRPQDFTSLIGQEAMVRILSNAFSTGRIAQAYLLTGVRGIGKTTTARIIAKGLNCAGTDGTGGPTVEPCGACEHCRAIIESRHVDVIEMDAASNTSVNDVREIIEAARYRPATARYKVYIIDETHMLSNSAFNALLKTLEEPPEHVKFIFATTEIRKMPITVLSRCQRFDLRRIETPVLIAHLKAIAEAEETEVTKDALAVIARAAEGSVRDALSLLDQAISSGGGKGVEADAVRVMLGLTDRARTLDLLDFILRGDAPAALSELQDQYASGADPAAIMRDLAESVHWLSTVKISPDGANDPALPPETRTRGVEMAGALGHRVLSRAWQMLLKALEELPLAPTSIMAAEMTVIRLCAVADLPPPAELIRQLQEAGSSPPSAPPPTPGKGPVGASSGSSAAGQAVASYPQNTPSPVSSPERLQNFEQVVALVRSKRDGVLLHGLEAGMRLVSFAPGRIEFTPTEKARRGLAGDLSEKLRRWTGMRWIVSVSGAGAEESIAEVRARQQGQLKARLLEDDLISAVIGTFPGAQIVGITERNEETGAHPMPVDDDTDAFE